jgi:glycerol-3-phosphate acyltransferase PlsY
MSFILILVSICIAYLIGSISSAILVCRLMNLPDPRTQGSHNPGATNVLRIGGKKAAIITLFGDGIKGFLPVLIGILFGFDHTIIAAIALAAFLGHLYPIFFKFEGGKGVATAIGTLIAVSWLASLCWFLTWGIMAALFRYSSLASLTASIAAPLYIAYFTGNQSLTIAYMIMATLLIMRHRSNIKKLLSGQENKLGQKKKSQTF